MQNNDTRGSLGEKFSQFGAPPKKDAWDAIAAQLDESKSNRKAIIWWWSGGIAATLLIVWILTTLLPASEIEATTITAKTRQKQQVPTTSTTKKHGTASSGTGNHTSAPTSQKNVFTYDSNAETSPKAHQRTQQHATHEKNQPSNDSPNIVPAPENQLSATHPQLNPTQEESNQLKDSVKEPDLAVVPYTDDSSDDEDNIDAIRVVVKYPKWRFGIYGMTASNDTKDQPVSTIPTETDINASGDVFGFDNSSQPPPYMRKDVGIQATIGRSFLKNRRLWLEAGIQYNRYTSKKYEDLGIDLFGNVTHETVGLPLLMTYNLASYHRWTVGVTGGVLNQFVYKTVQDVLIDNSFSIQSIESLEGKTTYHDRVHLVSGVVGLEVNYSITAHWQLSLQPQFRYYIGTGTTSPWSNTFQRQWLGGTAGIRYVLYK